MASRRSASFFLALFCFGFAMWHGQAHAASAGAEAKFLLATTAQQAFEEQAFERLESQARGYPERNHRLPNGDWGLSAFYNSFYSHPRAGAESNPRLAVSAKWLKRYPKSPTAYIVHAIQHLNTFHGLTQLIRVSEGAGLFDDLERYKTSAAKHLADARKLLVKGHKIASKDPFYYSVLVTVASLQGSSVSDMLKIIDDGFEDTPESASFHGAAIIAVSRAWPGDKAEVDRFVQRVLEVMDEEDRDLTYTNLYWTVGSFHGIDRIFQDWNVDWSRFSKGLADLLVRYPDDENGSWYARFACLAGDQKKTHELWSMAESFASPEIWPRADIYYGCQMLAHAPSDGGLAPAEGDVPGGL